MEYVVFGTDIDVVTGSDFISDEVIGVFDVVNSPFVVILDVVALDVVVGPGVIVGVNVGIDLVL